MNREQKSAAILEIAEQIRESEAIVAVDYRGISVPQAAELRSRLRDADASFRIVKNTLTERAADEAGTADLKLHLQGPTALTFVRGDIALAAKTLSDFQREHELLTFKGGLMGGESIDADTIRSLSRLPSREVLYGQLVGMIAAPITGLARGLNGLTSGLAIALGGLLDKKQSGEAPAGEAPAQAQEQTDQDAESPSPASSADAPAEGDDEQPQAEASADADETTTEADQEQSNGN